MDCRRVSESLRGFRVIPRLAGATLVLISVSLVVPALAQEGLSDFEERCLAPLSRAEEQRARALMDEAVGLTPEDRILSLIRECMDPDPNIPPIVRATIFDYLENQSIVVLLDLDAGLILSVATSEVQPPLSPEEADIALEAANADPTVREMAEEFEIDPEFTDFAVREAVEEQGSPTQVCTARRCAVVIYASSSPIPSEFVPPEPYGDGPVQWRGVEHRFQAVVDLLTLRVLDVIPY